MSKKLASALIFTALTAPLAANVTFSMTMRTVGGEAETDISSPAAFEPGAQPSLKFTLPKYRISTEDRDVIAACLVLESASQGELGMRAVMSVIRNRAQGRPEVFALTVLRERQFSALNKHTSGRESLWRVLQRAKSDPTWPLALKLVGESQRVDWQDPTLGATHYTRSVERTAWTRSLVKTVTIGAHSFYR